MAYITFRTTHLRAVPDSLGNLAEMLRSDKQVQVVTWRLVPYAVAYGGEKRFFCLSN